LIDGLIPRALAREASDWITIAIRRKFQIPFLRIGEKSLTAQHVT